MLVIIISLLMSFMYFGILCFFGKPSILELLVTMLGFILISGAAISVGMFASSITENQVIAGILTIAFLIVSLFIPQLDIGLPDISIINNYQNFPNGVISIVDVVEPITFMLMFMAFTIIVMQRRKLVK